MTTFRGWIEKRGPCYLWAAAVLLTLSAGWLVYIQFLAPSAYASSPCPYTVVLKVTLFDAAGTLKATIFHTEAVRSDGSRVVRMSGPQGKETHDTRVILFANGDSSQIDEIREMKTTIPRLYDSGPHLRQPQLWCMFSPGGSEYVAGEDTVGGYRTVQIKNGTQETRWYALDYGCAEVKSRVEYDTGVTEMGLLALIPGEPDAGLFRVPGSFAEVRPSEYYSRSVAAQRTSPPQSVATPAWIDRADKTYDARWARAKH